MAVILAWIVFGIAIGWAIGSFREGRGGLSTGWSMLAGLIGGVVSGFVSFIFGSALLGDAGIGSIFSFLGAAIGAVVVVILARVIFK